MRSWFKKMVMITVEGNWRGRKKELMITSSASDATLVKRVIVIYGIITEYLRKYLIILCLKLCEFWCVFSIYGYFSLMTSRAGWKQALKAFGFFLLLFM